MTSHSPAVHRAPGEQAQSREDGEGCLALQELGQEVSAWSVLWALGLRAGVARPELLSLGGHRRWREGFKIRRGDSGPWKAKVVFLLGLVGQAHAAFLTRYIFKVGQC